MYTCRYSFTPYIHIYTHAHTPHIHTCTHAHALEYCDRTCGSWIYHKCYQRGSLLNIPLWDTTWFHVSSLEIDGSPLTHMLPLLSLHPLLPSLFTPPPSFLPVPSPPQGSSSCHVHKSDCISVISAGLYMGLGTPQADLGRVELGEPRGLVDLHQTGHRRPPGDWLQILDQ